MSASLRAGNASDGYLQVDGADIVNLSSTGMSASTGKTITANAVDPTAAYRGTVLTDNDLSFDLSARNNFYSAPTGSGTITFTNIPDGQSGFILLSNPSGYTMSAHTNTKIAAADLTKITTAGTYRLDYASYGGNVYISVSGSFT